VFLFQLLPVALESAMEEDVEFRRGLPKDYLQHLGVAHSELNSNQRAVFLDKLRVLTDKLFRYAPVDAAADQMGKELLHSALPPKLDNGMGTSCMFCMVFV
jgi:lysine-specific demethylase/histidyl-hydroxylase NO66